ncbi:MAG TPA: hypothetical protein VEQ66_08955, partial [Propionibacteriaceae bacterium]|nr:hypothetical protein [Propionibacteriaceae bacterium]
RARAAHPDPRIGYVGDWHTHPAQIGASPTDETALRRASHQYPPPTVLIVVLPDGRLDIRTAHAGRIRPANLTIEPPRSHL